MKTDFLHYKSLFYLENLLNKSTGVVRNKITVMQNCYDEAVKIYVKD